MDDKLDAAGVVEGGEDRPPLRVLPRTHRAPPFVSSLPVQFYVRVAGRWSVAKDGKWNRIDQP